jgi:hypothetical protein
VVSAVFGGLRESQPAGCPPDLFNVLLSCWATEPAARPSFAELAVALGKLTCSDSVDGGGVSSVLFGNDNGNDSQGRERGGGSAGNGSGSTNSSGNGSGSGNSNGNGNGNGGSAMRPTGGFAGPQHRLSNASVHNYGIAALKQTKRDVAAHGYEYYDASLADGENAGGGRPAVPRDGQEADTIFFSRV